MKKVRKPLGVVLYKLNSKILDEKPKGTYIHKIMYDEDVQTSYIICKKHISLIDVSFMLLLISLVLYIGVFANWNTKIEISKDAYWENGVLCCNIQYTTPSLIAAEINIEDNTYFVSGNDSIKNVNVPYREWYNVKVNLYFLFIKLPIEYNQQIGGWNDN